MPAIRDLVPYDLPPNALTLFEDTFPSSITTVPWALTLANAATIAPDTTAGMWSSYGASMKYTSGTSASSEIHRYFARDLRYDRYVFAGRFAAMDENPSNFAFYLGARDGVNWTRSKLLHVYSTNVWSWQDSAGVQQTFLTRDTDENTANPRWHYFLIEANFRAGQYQRVAVDDTEAPVSNVAMRSTADATVPHMVDFAIEFTNTATPGIIEFDYLAGYAY